MTSATLDDTMSPVKRLGSTSPSRRERARATRLRITKAAYTLFCEQGYAGTTMADIAEAAGVAVQTVYFTFHTKGDVLSSAYDLAVVGDEHPAPPQEQPWYVAMVAEPSVARAVGWVVEGAGEIERRAAPLDLAVRAAAASDPDTARVWDRHEKMRAEGYRDIVDLLRGKGELRPGLTPERATDLLLLFVGPAVYRSLVMDRAWSHREWVDWTTATLLEQLFGLGDGEPGS
jgi:AcrR family transcriptional regulator